ncbi:hypothetical protein AK830_g11008 [Neonectria ditissima]|uniref:NAD-dependent epimerase/dehydratase domain-containing protein n=1 Tax=Neonectria ditissima TaxID=78410 RepID=A0A0N8H597_9HYPO|nr:hypothetical protein AK830_g11008 [Neonectria ditissima]
MTDKRIVLVTGANGYIAGPVIEAFLKAGYAVRGTVRSKTSANALVEALSQYRNDLDIVEVPDIVAPGAFDVAVKGVYAIAHLAAPVSLGFTDPDPVLEAAVEGTRGILKSALNETSIKSFIQMSSIAAVLNKKEDSNRFTEADWNTESLGAVKQFGKKSPGPLIYLASKVASERAFWEFRIENKPSFTMTAINPTFVMGPPVGLESPSKISGTTAFIWKVFAGQEIPAPISPEPGYVDVRDIARVVVFGVEHVDKADGERYILAKGVVTPQAAADVLREAFPGRRDIIKTGSPGKGYSSGFAFPETRFIDGSKAIEATGQDHYTVEQTIIDTAKFLEKFL